MKICLFTDNHWSSYSSIIRSQGDKYTTRLENQIKSLNWVESLALEHNCNDIVCLGDFFDKPDLNSQELSALKEVKWSSIPHKMIVGNHEMGINGLEYNSANALALNSIFQIIKNPLKVSLDDGSIELCYLPYILESNRKTIEDYFGPIEEGYKRIIFSHNDIAGIQMGQFKSVIGFELDDIKMYSHLFLNGHLHNRAKLDDGVYNLGNLTGQNFNEDALLYSHNAYILDTETLELKEFENPYAFNFYKLDYSDNMPELKANAVITIKAQQNKLEDARKYALSHSIASRVLVERESIVQTEDNVESLSVDHLQKFKDFVFEKIGYSDVVLSEVEEIIK